MKWLDEFAQLAIFVSTVVIAVVVLRGWFITL